VKEEGKVGSSKAKKKADEEKRNPCKFIA